jgi:hypothetical protein
MMFLLIFLACCYGCDWCFEHGRPGLAILVGVLFSVFYFVDRWMDQREGSGCSECDEDDEL